MFRYNRCESCNCGAIYWIFNIFICNVGLIFVTTCVFNLFLWQTCVLQIAVFTKSWYVHIAWWTVWLQDECMWQYCWSLSIFICPESTKTQYVNHIQRTGQETIMVLNTVLNTPVHKKWYRPKSIRKDQMKSESGLLVQ